MTVGFEFELISVEIRQYKTGTNDPSQLPLLSLRLHDKLEIFKTRDGLVSGVVEWGMNVSKTSAILELVTVPITDQDMLSTVLGTLDTLVDAFVKHPGAWYKGSSGQQDIRLEWKLDGVAFITPSGLTKSSLEAKPQVNFSVALWNLGSRIRMQPDPDADTMSSDKRSNTLRPEQRDATPLFPHVLGIPSANQQRAIDWSREKLSALLRRTPAISDTVAGFLYLAMYMLRNESSISLSLTPGQEKNRYCWLPRPSIYALATSLKPSERESLRQMWAELDEAIARDDSFVDGRESAPSNYVRDWTLLRDDLRTPTFMSRLFPDASSNFFKLLAALKNDCVKLFMLTISVGLGTPAAVAQVQKILGKGVTPENFTSKVYDLTQVSGTKHTTALVFEARNPDDRAVPLDPHGPIQSLAKRFADAAFRLDQ